ncbi:EVE domain-containing protein [Kordiimonas aquimaris]|uniref:EVE domain-containing protein n=1 Tax=Kordiimonas aquimaris TaxID=707591 RepID=UPI0021D3673E|nr:EVE domain-containing protein [Kordiimonas aquimaris]
MHYWLVKSEPGDWSWQDQLGVTSEPWDGVRNFQAQKNMRAMEVGDKVFFYHSGKERAVVGLCIVARASYPDPEDATERFCLVDLSAIETAASPVTLAAIKAEPALAEIALVRQSRLSVMPLSEQAFQHIYNMARFA